MKPKLMGGATSILGCIALLMAGLHLIADPLASAQTPQATTAFASAPTAPIDTAKQQIRPAFEVASVRPADPNAEGRGWGMKLTRAGRLTTSGMSLTSLVWLAYAGESAKPGMGQQVKGGPKWADSEQFDISAKVDDTVAASWVKLTDKERMQRVRPMMRTLLEDRFQLKLHTETQMKDTYAVIQAKGGAKLKEVAPPPDIPDGDDPSTPGRGDKKASDKPPPGTFQISGNGLWKGSAIKVGVLISECVQKLRRNHGRTMHLGSLLLGWADVSE
jgi:uncharacterized protein (TIGR03435 family)